MGNWLSRAAQMVRGKFEYLPGNYLVIPTVTGCYRPKINNLFGSSWRMGTNWKEGKKTEILRVWPSSIQGFSGLFKGGFFYFVA